jgi:hypothetical protein
MVLPFFIQRLPLYITPSLYEAVPAGAMTVAVFAALAISVNEREKISDIANTTRTFKGLGLLISTTLYRFDEE